MIAFAESVEVVPCFQTCFEAAVGSLVEPELEGGKAGSFVVAEVDCFVYESGWYDFAVCLGSSELRPQTLVEGFEAVVETDPEQMVFGFGSLVFPSPFLVERFEAVVETGPEQMVFGFETLGPQFRFLSVGFEAVNYLVAMFC